MVFKILGRRLLSRDDVYSASKLRGQHPLHAVDECLHTQQGVGSRRQARNLPHVLLVTLFLLKQEVLAEDAFETV